MLCIFHKWNGCKCEKCGKNRDEHHDWQPDANGCKCTRCGEVRTHVFYENKCVFCGLICEHEWDDGKCVHCGDVCQHEWEVINTGGYSVVSFSVSLDEKCKICGCERSREEWC